MVFRSFSTYSSIKPASAPCVEIKWRVPPRHRRDACSNPTHWLISTHVGDVARDGLHHVREVRRQAQDLFHFFLVQSTLLFSGESFKPVPLFWEVRGGDMHAPQALESPRSKLSSMAGVVAGPASKADAPRQNASPIESDDVRGSLPTKWASARRPATRGTPIPQNTRSPVATRSPLRGGDAAHVVAARLRECSQGLRRRGLQTLGCVE